MSTRAQVVIKDAEANELWFYRHSDGYPEGVTPTLNKFMAWLKAGRIRDNVEQAAGWLIVLGHLEYSGKPWSPVGEPDDGKSGLGWKVGAYEPCACRAPHGDIEYLYTLDLDTKTITCQARSGGWGLDETPTFCAAQAC